MAKHVAVSYVLYLYLFVGHFDHLLLFWSALIMNHKDSLKVKDSLLSHDEEH